jgi:arylsulfatase
MGKGGTATLTVNGAKVAEAKIPMTQPILFSADETADVGIDDATPVVESVGAGHASRFTGKINKVTIDLKPMTTGAANEAEEGQRQAIVKMGLSN